MIKDLNISVIVPSLDFIQGSIKTQALKLQPYELPKSMDILVGVDIESTITLQEIANRVTNNREAMKKKVLKSSFKQDEFEKNSKYICEVR